MNVRRVSEASLPSRFGGEFRAVAYEDDRAVVHLALIRGEVSDGQPVLVRVHSKCLTGDTLGSERCDCGPQLEVAMRRIATVGRGVVLYMDEEGRGIGLVNKLRAYALQENGHDTVTANQSLGFPGDLREYTSASAILRDLGVSAIQLMTNNPAKIARLEEQGIRVVERVSIEISPTFANVKYLKTKRDKMGHLLTAVGE